MLRPDPIAKKAFLFALLPLALIAIDWIDPATGGKIALYSLLSSLCFGYAAAWLEGRGQRDPQARWPRVLRAFILAVFFTLVLGLLFFMFFESALRTMFGVHQDQFNVFNAIFSTDARKRVSSSSSTGATSSRSPGFSP